MPSARPDCRLLSDRHHSIIYAKRKGNRHISLSISGFLQYNLHAGTKICYMGGMHMEWNGKPYHSLDYEMKRRFRTKIYKISLDGGMTCPNRDGTIGTRGCIFCSEGGFGDFAVPYKKAAGGGYCLPWITVPSS